MEKFEVVEGIAAPLLLSNIDTDTISPAFISGRPGLGRMPTSQEELSEHLFGAWRYDSNGQEQKDFILNQPTYRNARILLTGDNFGCGSSREIAVKMLQAYGLRCIIAPSFGEIFYNNCFKGGVLPIALPAERIRQFIDMSTKGGPSAIFRVDLESMSITAPDGSKTSFSVPSIRRTEILEGLDEVDITLQRIDEINDFQKRQREQFSWI